jgi:hypothetical protein
MLGKTDPSHKLCLNLQQINKTTTLMETKISNECTSDDLLQMLLNEEITLLHYVLHQPQWIVTAFDFWCATHSRPENDLSAFDFLSELFGNDVPDDEDIDY